MSIREDDPQHEAKWIHFMQAIEPDISPQAVRLIGDVRRIGYALQQISQASVAESGLSHSQYQILLSLYMQEQVYGRSQLNPSEISRVHGTTRNTVSSLIRSLEDDGLIERRLDKQDRRKFNICLTENGRALVNQFAQKHIRIVGGCFNSLSQEQQAILAQLLDQVRHNLDQARDQLEALLEETHHTGE